MLFKFLVLAGRRVLGAQQKRWHRGKPSALDGSPCVSCDYGSPQIAKDVKQFYDQALQQAMVDDEANNAKTVVKTFHETVQLGWSREGRLWGS